MTGVIAVAAEASVEVDAEFDRRTFVSAGLLDHAAVRASGFAVDSDP